MGIQGNGKAKMSEVRQYPCTSEGKVWLLKLGSAAAVSLRKRLRKVLSTMSGRMSTQSVRNILVKQITAINVMEDKKKGSLPGFIKSLDEGNLFVFKFECIPFLESFSKVFSGVVNHEGYNLLCNKLFKVSIKPFVYQIYIIFYLCSCTVSLMYLLVQWCFFITKYFCFKLAIVPRATADPWFWFCSEMFILI